MLVEKIINMTNREIVDLLNEKDIKIINRKFVNLNNFCDIFQNAALLSNDNIFLSPNEFLEIYLY